jgi:tetratricopeptide (TPR) repeat protein
LYIATEDYVQAEDFCQRALEVLEGSVGPDNDHTAVALNRLASAYMYQGKYLEAQNLCSRALDILENFFGGNHPNMGQVLGTMAELYRLAGDNTEVAELAQRIEEITFDRQIAKASVLKRIE